MSSGSWFALHAAPSAPINSAFCPAGGLHCPRTGSPVTGPGARRGNAEIVLPCNYY